VEIWTGTNGTHGRNKAWKTLEAMNEKVDGLYDAFYIGNGKPSVMVRLDRLEQKGRIIWGAFIAVIGKVLHNSVG